MEVLDRRKGINKPTKEPVEWEDRARESTRQICAAFFLWTAPVNFSAEHFINQHFVT